MSFISLQTPLIWNLPDDSPSLEGELLACRTRFVMIAIILLYPLLYLYLYAHHPLAAVSSFFLAASSCLVANTLLQNQLEQNRFRGWMSVASTLMDVLIAVAIVELGKLFYPLNIATSVITVPFFLAIALAALRRSTRLVILAGILASLFFLLLATPVFEVTGFDRKYLTAVESTTHLLSLSYADLIAKALIMLVSALLIATLTRRLRNAEHQYQVLFEHIPDGIVTTDRDGKIQSANQSFVQLAHTSQENLTGRQVREIVGAGPASVLLSKTGESIPISITRSTVSLLDETRQVFSVRNVADKLNIQNQLSRSQKLDTLGHLAGGLAHDFNNFLGGIVGASSLIKKNATSLPAQAGERVQRYMAIVDDCAENARDVLKKLLAFSKSSMNAVAPVNLWSFLSDVEKMCSKTFGGSYQIHLTREAAAQSAWIDGDENALTQAILNLCMNARDAMPEGGKISLALSEFIPTHPFLLRHPDCFSTRAYWKIEVFDQGRGMPVEVLAQASDPFFSTKEPRRRGSGLGLPMVHSIVKQHDGMLEIDSVENEGTRIRIFLPHAKESAMHGRKR